MGVSTNARTKKQTDLVNLFADKFGDTDDDYDVSFDGTNVTVTNTETGEIESEFATYPEFRRHLEDDDGADEGIEAAPEPAPEPAPQEAPDETPEPAQEATEQPASEQPEPAGDDGDSDTSEIEAQLGDDLVEDQDLVEGDDDDPEPAPEPEPAEAAKPEPKKKSGGKKKGGKKSASKKKAAKKEEPEPETAEPETAEPAPEPEPQRDPATLKDKIQKAKEERGEPRPKDPTERAHQDLEKLIRDMANTVIQERTGEIEKNEARWAKGEQVSRVDEIAARYKQAGNQQLGSRSGVLAFATEAVDEAVRKTGVIETVSRLTENELAITKGAFDAFAKHHGGAKSTFQYVDQLDAHGNRLTNDAGEPYVKQVGEIAVNKAYLLKEFATEENRDRILSFAVTYSEATCRGLRNLLREKGAHRNTDRVDDVLDAFYEQKATIEDDAGEEVKISLNDQEARDYFRASGSEAAPDVKSIRVDAAFYDGMWTDVMTYSSLIWKWLGNPVHPKRGTMSNTVVLERALDYFAPANHGFGKLVAMFVEAGDMTEEQAARFLEEHQDFDPNQEPQ